MPVVFNEPISFLQRITEYMEYSYLLERANVCETPEERMAVSRNWAKYRISRPCWYVGHGRYVGYVRHVGYVVYTVVYY